jgi:ATP-binding cassette subfamily C (CFTR/MRP) protein 1
MSFFDTTPIGRIINRFAKDIDAVDTTLSEAFSQSLITLITVVATLVILIYGSWFVIIGLIPLAVLFAFIQVKFFVKHEKLSLCICSVYIYRLLDKFVVWIQLHVV